jgi:glycosyltransferase involved in cell wall biosynthesis
MARRRLTVVFCCNSLWGLVNFRGRVIQALVNDGHRVVLVALDDHPVDHALALGAEFVEWRVAPRGANPLHEFAALRDLARIYRELSPDCAFHFTVKPVMYGAFIARRTHTQVISVITGLGYLFLKRGPRQWLAHLFYRATLRRSRAVWFLNTDDREIFARAGLTKGLAVHTLPGEGIDIGHFAPARPPEGTDNFVFLMVARLLRDKGVMEYAEAARIVRRKHPQVRFRLLGPSYDANAASVSLETVRAWQAEGLIEYLGGAHDVRPALAACHCVVLPSYREGMPRVLMEAAAMRRPAIATDVPGCRDVVNSGKTGLLCAVRSVESLAEACETMLTMSAEARDEMAAQARKMAEETFDDALIISRYRAVIAELDGSP